MGRTVVSFVLSIQEITESDRPRVGRKGFALAVMAQKGLRIPPAVCISTEAYQDYLHSTGLQEKILNELHRKAFEDMRWEKIWEPAPGSAREKTGPRAYFPQEA